MKLKLIEEEICPRCGEKFECSKSGKCWCYELTLENSILEKLVQKYNSCLCPACLAELALSVKQE
jgi:hypothetical protein